MRLSGWALCRYKSVTNELHTTSRLTIIRMCPTLEYSAMTLKLRWNAALVVYKEITQERLSFRKLRSTTLGRAIETWIHHLLMVKLKPTSPRVVLVKLYRLLENQDKILNLPRICLVHGLCDRREDFLYMQEANFSSRTIQKIWILQKVWPNLRK